MPAPAPVAADPVKLIPSNPKPKIDPASRAPDSRGAARDTPRFDDALKQAQAKPRQADAARDAKPPQKTPKAQKAQKAQKPAKGKSAKSDDKPAESSAPAEQATDAPPDQTLPTDSEGAEAPPTDVITGEQTVESPDEPVVELTDIVAVAVSPPPPGVVDADAVHTEGGESTAVETDAAGAATPAVARVTAPRPGAAAPLSGSDGDLQDAAASATDNGALVEAAESENAPANEAPPETESPVTSPTARPASQKATAATKSAAAVKAGDAVAATEQPEMSGKANLGNDGASPQDQTEQQSPNVLVEAVERAATKSASAAPAHGTTTAPGDAVDALSASVKPAPAVPTDPAPTPAPGAPAAPTAREVEFAQANHDRLVTAMRAELLPRGGTMQIRLDPPELGSLQVAVHMLDGVMSVSFQTSNDEATQLLSHSLTQLKHVLESQGVAVDRLHVQQAPRSESSSTNSNDPDQNQQRHGAPGDENLARQEQQRKEMLRRMWRRLALGSDPLDLVA